MERHRAQVVLAVVGAVLVVAGGLLLWRGLSASGTTPDGPVVTDMRGRPVVLDRTDLTPQQTARQHAEPTGRGRFAVPSVGLDVPLGSLDEVDAQITPPGATSAYWVANRGVGVDDAADGTVYVVMHALHGGGVGPGNYLFDVATGQSRVQAGDEIEVGTRTYRVTAWFSVPKPQLPADGRVWADTPGRLVVVTCLPTSDLPAGVPAADNFVVEATLAQR